MASFSDQVDDWTRETKERVDAVYARSVEILGEEMSKTRPQGGRVPFDTGNLSRSLLASTSGLPSVSEGPFVGSNVGLIAATLEADDTVWLGYQAKYAMRVNYGYIGEDSLGRIIVQGGAHFVEAAESEWDNIVSSAVKEIRYQAGA